MDGTNAAGRKVSLLNDHEPSHNLVRLNSFTPSLRSRTSSYSSSPIGSPPTPQLVRSNSSDSNMRTPSPITPDFTMDGNFAQEMDSQDMHSQGMDSPVFSQANYFPPQKEMAMNHHYHHPQQLHPYPAVHPAPSEYFAHQQAPEPPTAPAAPLSANGRKGKNSYPCPMAKLYNCTDHFTTSGHAARHAKKHTGKKDAHCPDCGKSFTRKDNMEQHRRTHQSGRNSTKGADRDMRKAKQARRPKVAPLQSTPPMAHPSMVDPSLPISPAASYMAPAVQPMDQYMNFVQRSMYPDPTTFALIQTDFGNSGQYGNLDILASAASGAERKFSP